MTLKAGPKGLATQQACNAFSPPFFPLFPQKIVNRGQTAGWVNKFFSELQCSATTTTSCGHHTHKKRMDAGCLIITLHRRREMASANLQVKAIYLSFRG
jgi:hypothetical protein